jgi:Ca2+-transporting ATPase
MNNWYKRKIADVAQELKSNPSLGLDPQEVARRLAHYGPNELVERGLKSPWLILWEQLTATMVVILIIAAVISAILGDTKDAIAILIIVVLNALLGFHQEYRAEKAMAALKRLAVPAVKVRRSGHVQELSARELVPGDVVLLETGNLVPADCRLLESANLRTQEAALTGESQPVEKTVADLAGPDLPLGDRHNMVYMGTVVTYGRGQALVTETGMKTELGAIATMIQSVGQEQTPLQRRLDQLGRKLALAAVGIVVVVFLLGVLRGEDLKLMFMTAMSMAVAAVPEGLPAVVTITLALGAQRMLKRRALIRKLPAVEALGSTTVICSDKTGTLTENRMTVTVLDVAGHQLDLVEHFDHHMPTLENGRTSLPILQNQPALALLLAGSALCNDAVLEQEAGNGQPSYHAVGDPTEGALVVAAARFGLWKATLDQTLPRVAEAPFDAERKRMTTVHQVQTPAATTNGTAQPFDVITRQVNGSPFVAFTKGAVDQLLAIATQVWNAGTVEVLDEAWSQRVLATNDQLAQRGMRVLGLAFRPLATMPADGIETLEQELIFVGMIGMVDPPRPEVKDAVATCKNAGIRPVMITGDHPLTARQIAHELGIANGSRVLTGQEIDKLPAAALATVIDEVSVYARVSPEHKLRLVSVLQEKGHIVAMTGDGVNDAPALRKAEIGVAMGITGTDVSKEAADMVLLDDNFATIVAAVEEGRVIYDNIRKFIKYTMTSNSGEIWVMLLAPFLGMPLPLLPLQILWINLVTDGLPGLALGVEPGERNLMRRPPYHPDENIFGRGMGRHIIVIGLMMGLVSLALGYWYWLGDSAHWQTIVFTTLTLSQMGHALAIRSGRDSLFTIGLLSNRALLASVLLTFALQLAVIYLPFLQGFFQTTALPLPELLVSLALSTVVFWGVEIEKWLTRRQGNQP